MGLGIRLSAPQSNQRGIETHLAVDQALVQRVKPQSNQRGIETRGRADAQGAFGGASIEPAWD